MSNPFNNSSIITLQEHDKVTRNPAKQSCNHYCSSCKKIFMVGGRVSTALAQKTKKHIQDRACTSDDAMSSSSSISSSATDTNKDQDQSASSSTWQKRITSDDFLQKQLRAKMKCFKEARMKR